MALLLCEPEPNEEFIGFRFVLEEGNMKKYTLKKEYKYVIYGAGFMGALMLEGMEKAGYCVSAFLDKRAAILKTIKGVPVYHPDEFQDDGKGNTVVIVAIMNPFEHPKVAAGLSKKGYKKIIFKLSADNRYKAEYARNMFQLYEDLQKGSIDGQRAAVEYTADFADVYFEEEAVIKRTEHSVIAFVPLELCFELCDFPVITAENGQPNPDIVSAFDKPILFGDKWLIDLFRAFEGNGNIGKIIYEFKEYLKRNPWRYYSYPRTEQGMDELIANRYTMFMQLSQFINKSGMEFFINTPIEVEWGGKGYFHVLDGAHRICFFLAKGFTRIPARMKKEAYEKWRNQDKLKTSIGYLKEHGCPPMNTPVPHPCFYNYPAYRDEAGILRISHILEYFRGRQVDLKGKRILEIGSSYSYFAQCFYRMGAKVTAMRQDNGCLKLEKILNELVYCDGIEAIFGDICEIKLDQQYDIAIMLTYFEQYTGTVQGKAMLQKIDRAVDGFLLWESGADAESEINFIMAETSFLRYEKIAATYGTGKARELGIFYK